ncbi:RDD family protein [Solicola gregarius]|uniref:RDD family protein n=1 Tax=Solicola gregarius TaxID=2908642 RepID=A0AA46THP4_9ACTN|nr:RDD family protein [Solicola gregarius]UYM05455.1 RDD family protein [Solicola gregarius]
MSESAQALQAAGWPRRIIALFIDWFVALLTVSAIAGTPIWESNTSSWWNLLAFFVEVSVLTGLLGYSIGQRIAGVKIVRVDGAQLDPLRAAVRTALICVIIPPLINDERRRGLHDRAVGSIAVRR